MLIEELAKEVHVNAVAHGWWEDEREAPEIIALIHSEWSEALEEARAGRPMVYRLCAECNDGPCIVEPGTATACGFDTEKHKPEGIAVELIDGCIRILDYLGRMDVGCREKDGRGSEIEGLYEDAIANEIPEKISHLVAYLHLCTSRALPETETLIPFHALSLLAAMAAALSWVKKQGLDPLEILLEKHAYNKTRPYKHGKQF